MEGCVLKTKAPMVLLALVFVMGLAGAASAAQSDSGAVNVVVPSYRHIEVGDATIEFLASDFGITTAGPGLAWNTVTASIAWVHNYTGDCAITVQASAWQPATPENFDGNIKLEVEYLGLLGTKPTPSTVTLTAQNGLPPGGAQNLLTGIARGYEVSSVLYTVTLVSDGSVQADTYTSTVTYTVTSP
jgi:hypothetical protein